MNRYEPILQISHALQVSNPSEPSGSETARLVVVIREVEEEAMLAGRILQVAESRGLAILLVGIAPDSSGASALRRKLVTIAAFIGEELTRTGSGVKSSVGAHAPDIRVEQGRNWLAGVRMLLTPSDTLACYSAENIRTTDKPMDDVLGTALNRPIYTFTGLHRPPRSSRNYLSQAAAWVGSLGSIVAFFAMQARIVVALHGLAQSFLLFLALAAEIGCIWLLNSLLGQF
jgi:hypothetical protein